MSYLAFQLQSLHQQVEAEIGHEGPLIFYYAEYDALLPGIGHACGHNLIRNIIYNGNTSGLSGHTVR